jgi:hypothetical protein
MGRAANPAQARFPMCRSRLYRTLASLLAGMAAVALGACELLPGVGTIDEPALIIFYEDTTRVVVPDTVTRGVPFTVSFMTFGGGCTREVARTDVRRDGNLLEIRPYNRRQKADGGVCTADLLFLEHRVAEQFDQAGGRVRQIRRQEDTR